MCKEQYIVIDTFTEGGEVAELRSPTELWRVILAERNLIQEGQIFDIFCGE